MAGEKHKSSEEERVEDGAGDERSESEARASTRGAPDRRSAEDRRLAVMQVLTGKASVDQVAHRLGVHPETVEKWRDLALEGIEEALRQGSGKSGRERELEKKLDVLEKAFTDLAIRNELAERALRSRPTRPGKS